MTDVLWRDEYAVGDDVIDRQHKELFRRVGDFVAACKANEAPGILWDLFVYLEDYTVVHFTTEEHIQRDSGYQDYERHLKMHGGFIEKLGALRKHFEKYGPQPEVLRDMQEFVTEWLVRHVVIEDSMLGRHLQENPQDRKKSLDATSDLIRNRIRPL